MRVRTATGHDITQYVAFKIGEQEFGAEIHKVSIIEKDLNYARVPTTPSYIKGVVNLRGEIIPVMSLRLKFELPEIPVDEDTRTIVFTVNESLLGIIVDSVDEVISVNDSDIESVTSITNDKSLDYIVGIAKVDGRLVTLLNLEKLVADLLEKQI